MKHAKQLRLVFQTCLDTFVELASKQTRKQTNRQTLILEAWHRVVARAQKNLSKYDVGSFDTAVLK